MLSVRVDQPAEDLVVIVVAGEIDSVTAPKLSTALHRELERRPAVLILDLTAVSFLGVAGLHVLGCALDRSKTLSVSLSVVHDEESAVQSALRAAAMTGDFPTFRTVNQARTSSAPVTTTGEPFTHSAPGHLAAARTVRSVS
jgi:anti-sigma B factor antagonist